MTQEFPSRKAGWTLQNLELYWNRRAGRVIAGPAFARGQAGRKVRTPWSSRFLAGR